MQSQSKCKKCFAPVLWKRNPKSGKMQLLDLNPKTIIDLDGNVHTGRESHFATCPNADEFRKPKGGKS